MLPRLEHLGRDVYEAGIGDVLRPVERCDLEHPSQPIQVDRTVVAERPHVEHLKQVVRLDLDRPADVERHVSEGSFVRLDRVWAAAQQVLAGDQAAALGEVARDLVADFAFVEDAGARPWRSDAASGQARAGPAARRPCRTARPSGRSGPAPRGYRSASRSRAASLSPRARAGPSGQRARARRQSRPRLARPPVRARYARGQPTETYGEPHP